MVICMNDVFKQELSTSKIDNLSLKRKAKELNLSESRLLAEFSFYLLYVLRLRVKHSIETQTIDGMSMRSLYKQLSPTYKKFNKNNAGRFWKDTEWLMDNMQVWFNRITGNVHLGIPENIKHPNSNTKAQDIFKYLEFGTKDKSGKVKIPARPLIYPHLTFMLNNINTYFSKYLELRSEPMFRERIRV